MTTKVANVLVVEDDTSTLQCERLILEGGGYSVTWAASGEQAIEMVADASPDLVIMDIGLPGIDGFTTCKVIRKFSQVPIIMVSGNNSEADKVKGLNTGADDYLTKPFSEQELFARSKAALRRSTFSYKVFQGVTSLRGGFLKLVRSLKHSRASAPIIRRRASQLFSAFRPQAGNRRDAVSGLRNSFGSFQARLNFAFSGVVRNPRWSLLRQQTKWLALKTWNAAYLIASSLALLARETSTHIWNSPAADRVKATRPAMKLAAVSARVLRSDYARSTRSGFSRAWDAASDYMAAFLSSFNHNRGAVADSYSVTIDLDPVTPAPLLGSETTESQITQAHPIAFLEELLRAYIRVAETTCTDPMVSTPVVPLVEVYEQLIASGRLDEACSRQEFAQEVYRLHRSGVDTTLTGARVQFPISRGVSGKTLQVSDESGHKVRYYGIRFLPNTSSDRDHLAECQPFDVSQAEQYQSRIQEMFRRQLEWPSEEFTWFVAAQINLGGLDLKQSRQFAQITRDSLQGLIKDYATRHKSEASQEPLRLHDT